MAKNSKRPHRPHYLLDRDPIEIDPGPGIDAVQRFDIVGYGMELISNPADGAWVPTLFLNGTQSGKEAVAIVYFHEDTAIGQPNWDSVRNVCYIHYPLVLFESVMDVLRSKEPIQFYWKDIGDKKWSGLNFKKTVPRRS